MPRFGRDWGAIPSVWELKLRVAVIGGGIAGLSASWLLSKKCQVTLFEKASKLGGHSNTIDVQAGDKIIPIDTGFIVFNKATYPNLVALFDYLKVRTDPSEMSFSVSMDKKRFEYSGNNLNGLFGQRRNLLNLKFWRMLMGIWKFYRTAPELILKDNSENLTLGEFLDFHNFSEEFCQNHLLPMGAAIWSASESDIREYPAVSFVKFFINHGLLNFTQRPQWYTVHRGSREYVAKLLKDFSGHVKFSEVKSIKRTFGSVKVEFGTGEIENYDQVVIATHADQAFKLLDDPTNEEIKLLSNWKYSSNRAVLHQEPMLMPKTRRVWGSWNFIESEGQRKSAEVSLTYWMNRLQNIDLSEQFFVSLNPPSTLADTSVIAEFFYEHPIFDANAIKSQRSLWSLQGVQNTWFCGSYFGSGFHEDGLQSGLAVAEVLGNVKRPWALKNRNSRISTKPEHSEIAT